MEPQDRRKIPALNTQQIDLTAYDELRKHFFAEYVKFRRGNIKSGEPALNDLLMMYQTLPAIRHFNTKKEEAALFIEKIDMLNNDIDAMKGTGCLTSSKEHIKRMDDLYMDFGRIMYSLNFTR